jgi:hypothetical protein
MNSVRARQVANDRARRAHGFLPIVVAATLIGSILGIPSIQVWQVQLSELLLLSCWRAAFAGVLAQVLARAGSELQ